jgi:hypothetical protein
MINSKNIYFAFIHKKRARIAASPFLFCLAQFLELTAQCDAIGPRFGKELREDLATTWILWIDKWCRGCTRLERRVEGDLSIILVKDILTPKLNTPSFVRAA